MDSSYYKKKVPENKSFACKEGVILLKDHQSQWWKRVVHEDQIKCEIMPSASKASQKTDIFGEETNADVEDSEHISSKATISKSKVKTGSALSLRTKRKKISKKPSMMAKKRKFHETELSKKEYLAVNNDTEDLVVRDMIKDKNDEIGIKSDLYHVFTLKVTEPSLEEVLQVPVASVIVRDAILDDLDEEIRLRKD